MKVVLGRVKDEEGEKTYPGTTLKYYNETILEHCKKEALADLERLNANMQERLE